MFTDQNGVNETVMNLPQEAEFRVRVSGGTH